MKNQLVGKNHVFPVSTNQNDRFMEGDLIKFKPGPNLPRLRACIVIFAVNGMIPVDEAKIILETNSISQEVARKILRYDEVSRFGKRVRPLPNSQRSVSLSKYNCN